MDNLQRYDLNEGKLKGYYSARGYRRAVTYSGKIGGGNWDQGDRVEQRKPSGGNSNEL
jgi:hypothetical protein